METNEKSYHGLAEIKRRMRCGKKALMVLFVHEHFPVTKIGKRYVTTEAAILKWIEGRIK